MKQHQIDQSTLASLCLVSGRAGLLSYGLARGVNRALNVAKLCPVKRAGVLDSRQASIPLTGNLVFDSNASLYSEKPIH